MHNQEFIWTTIKPWQVVQNNYHHKLKSYKKFYVLKYDSFGFKEDVLARLKN